MAKNLPKILKFKPEKIDFHYMLCYISHVKLLVSILLAQIVLNVRAEIFRPGTE